MEQSNQFAELKAMMFQALPLLGGWRHGKDGASQEDFVPWRAAASGKRSSKGKGNRAMSSEARRGPCWAKGRDKSSEPWRAYIATV